MRVIDIFLFEWKHFIRSPFKIIALVLFMIAGVYGLHKGANLYHQHTEEVAKIKESVSNQRQEIIDTYFKSGNTIPEARPWIDYSTPFWAIWYSSVYYFKEPSPAMVYSIGQAEQYGFYKKITFRASPYDSDLAEEIANPERLQTGTLDFSFALLFLMPLVLLVLIYNLKSSEKEQGFLPLIQVQNSKTNAWLLCRISFYVVVLFLFVITLLLYGTMLTPIFNEASTAFFSMLISSAFYLVFWAILFFIITTKTQSVLASTLQMSSLYLVFAFIIPATVHQVLSIKQPTNLMTDFIDVRDQQEALYAEADSIIEMKLIKMFPEIEYSPVYQDESKVNLARNRSYAALTNVLKKASIAPIEKENQLKNEFISSTFWFNPVTYFQNRINTISKTHFNDYQEYRDQIQDLIDAQISVLIQDMWSDKKIDESGYKEYFKL